ncbi:MAG: CRTAC1 family protein [Planctomycetaceae bacterium]
MRNRICLLIVFLSVGCTQEKTTTPEPVATPKKFEFKPPVSQTPGETPVSEAVVAFPKFVDVAAEVGINHIYDNGASPKALMVESTGGGAGWFDFDRDGLVDLLLTQGGIPCPADGNPGKSDALFRQRATGGFADCFQASAMDDRGFGHGVACGDFDNDGFEDVFVANAGRSRLFRNMGDGTFEDVTESLTGLRSVWSSSCTWCDPDRDGNLDLYVCNYTQYDPCNPIQCLDKDGIPSICHPRNVEPEPDFFFASDGEGGFRECANERGLFGPGNKGLGVVVADLNDDQWPDIYVANDTTANFVFINDGTGRSFSNQAAQLGGAVAGTGEPQASMGIAFGDFDNNGLPDLLLTHFSGEQDTLYQNLGPQGFVDVSAKTGLRQPTLPKLGFGTVMADFNGDSRTDLFITNGHIDPRYEESEGYAMTPQLFSFNGERWLEYSPSEGDFFAKALVGRGVATADIDHDGDLDLCVVHHNTPVAILRNQSQCERMLNVRLHGTSSCRSAIGTTVKVSSSDQSWKQELAGGTSYAATHEKVLNFGLGDTKGELKLEVCWATGKCDQLTVPEGVGAVEILEGRGIVRQE